MKKKLAVLPRHRYPRACNANHDHYLRRADKRDNALEDESSGDWTTESDEPPMASYEDGDYAAMPTMSHQPSLAPTLIYEHSPASGMHQPSPEPDGSQGTPDDGNLQLVLYSERQMTPALNVASAGGYLDAKAAREANSALDVLVALFLQARHTLSPEAERKALHLLLRAFSHVNESSQQRILAVILNGNMKAPEMYKDAMVAVQTQMGSLLAAASDEQYKRALVDMQALYDRVCKDGNAAMDNMRALVSSTCKDTAEGLHLQLTAEFKRDNQVLAVTLSGTWRWSSTLSTTSSGLRFTSVSKRCWSNKTASWTSRFLALLNPSWLRLWTCRMKSAS